MEIVTPTIPSIFQGAKEYRDLPEALELAQRTFNEEAMYQHITGFAQAWHRSNKRNARILDLCSATGWAAVRVAKAIPSEFVTLVDLDQGALKKAETYFCTIAPAHIAVADAIIFKDSRRYDLILMNSAYHHIEDDQKVAFLQNALKLLAKDGIILAGEHFLPPYENKKDYRAAVVHFYSILLEDLKERNEPEAAINVIRRSGLYCWEKRYEYKVSFSRFKTDVHDAGLRVRSYERIWPVSNAHRIPESSGSFVLELESLH